MLVQALKALAIERLHLTTHGESSQQALDLALSVLRYGIAHGDKGVSELVVRDDALNQALILTFKSHQRRIPHHLIIMILQQLMMIHLGMMMTV